MSLRKFLLEETYEVYDALEQGSTPALAEELGDLLLQVILHAQFAAEAGDFAPTLVKARASVNDVGTSVGGSTPPDARRIVLAAVQAGDGPPVAAVRRCASPSRPR